MIVNDIFIGTVDDKNKILELGKNTKKDEFLDVNINNIKDKEIYDKLRKNPIFIVNCFNVFDSIKSLYSSIYNIVLEEFNNINNVFSDHKIKNKIVYEASILSDYLMWDENVLKEYMYFCVTKNFSLMNDDFMKDAVAYIVYNHCKASVNLSKIMTSYNKRFSECLYFISSNIVKNSIFLDTLVSKRKTIMTHFKKLQTLSWLYSELNFFSIESSSSWYYTKNLVALISNELSIYSQSYTLDSLNSSFDNLDFNYGNNYIKEAVRDIIKYRYESLEK